MLLKEFVRRQAELGSKIKALHSLHGRLCNRGGYVMTLALDGELLHKTYNYQASDRVMDVMAEDVLEQAKKLEAELDVLVKEFKAS